MKLGEWRRARGWTQQQLSDAIDCVIATVARYENGTRLPERDIMKRIYIVSERSVTPNDFYDVPAWEAERIRAEAEAEIAAKAA